MCVIYSNVFTAAGQFDLFVFLSPVPNHTQQYAGALDGTHTHTPGPEEWYFNAYTHTWHTYKIRHDVSHTMQTNNTSLHTWHMHKNASTHTHMICCELVVVLEGMEAALHEALSVPFRRSSADKTTLTLLGKFGHACKRVSHVPHSACKWGRLVGYPPEMREYRRAVCVCVCCRRAAPQLRQHRLSSSIFVR